ncbi:MAG: efflux RND transporter periplasmic adaptor subunit [Flavobacterium sp.]|nr:efflux RND transporter periplasmic adaptor subunit [Candidatus Neoflavobacterium equi]
MKIQNLQWAFCSLLLTVACSKPAEKEAEVTYEVTAAQKTDTLITNQYVSQLKAVKHIKIRSQERGYLQKIYVDEGQYVTKGQLLFQIMPNLYQSEYAKAMAEVKEAETEVQNSKMLTDHNVVSKNELVVAKARLDKARAEMGMAKQHLSFTEIRAPFSGIIDHLHERLGSLIEEGTLLTSLSDNAEMYAYFNVSEPEYLDYQMNAANRGMNQVGLLLANNQLFPKQGKIETIEGDFNNETGNIAFRAKFNNDNKLLRHGQTGKIQMQRQLKNVLLIPQKATFEIQDQIYVYVVDAKGGVHARNVKVNAQLPNLYVVNQGLTEKEHILLEGIQKVKEADVVQTKFVAPADVMAGLDLKVE